MSHKWERIEAGPDAVEVKSPRVGNGWVTIRVISPDGEVTLKPEEAQQLLLKIAAALEVAVAKDVPEPAKAP